MADGASKAAARELEENRKAIAMSSTAEQRAKTLERRAERAEEWARGLSPQVSLRTRRIGNGSFFAVVIQPNAQRILGNSGYREGTSWAKEASGLS